jgi:hypothetical protein
MPLANTTPRHHQYRCHRDRQFRPGEDLAAGENSVPPSARNCTDSLYAIKPHQPARSPAAGHLSLQSGSQCRRLTPPGLSARRNWRRLAPRGHGTRRLRCSAPSRSESGRCIDVEVVRLCAWRVVPNGPQPSRGQLTACMPPCPAKPSFSVSYLGSDLAAVHATALRATLVGVARGCQSKGCVLKISCPRSSAAAVAAAILGPSCYAGPWLPLAV